MIHMVSSIDKSKGGQASITTGVPFMKNQKSSMSVSEKAEGNVIDSEKSRGV